MRGKKLGRGVRPLSSKEPLHLVLKVRRDLLQKKSLRVGLSFSLINALVRKYSRRFYVKVEQVSIQGDHVHLLIRAYRRSNYQAFFRVLAGQIAQRFLKEHLLTKCWMTDTPEEIFEFPPNHRQRASLRLQAEKAAEDAAANGRNPAMTDTPRSPSNQAPNPKRATAAAKSVIDFSGQWTGTALWKYRPFTRVVRGYRAYKIVRDYVQLNEAEACGRIKYSKYRLKGLSSADWSLLWD